MAHNQRHSKKVVHNAQILELDSENTYFDLQKYVIWFEQSFLPSQISLWEAKVFIRETLCLDLSKVNLKKC